LNNFIRIFFFFGVDIFLKKFFFNELNRFISLFFIIVSYILGIFFDKNIVEGIVSNLSKLNLDIESYPTVYFKYDFLCLLLILCELVFVSTVVTITFSQVFVILIIYSNMDLVIDLTEKLTNFLSNEKKK